MAFRFTPIFHKLLIFEKFKKKILKEEEISNKKLLAPGTLSPLFIILI